MVDTWKGLVPVLVLSQVVDVEAIEQEKVPTTVRYEASRMNWREEFQKETGFIPLTHNIIPNTPSYSDWLESKLSELQARVKGLEELSADMAKWIKVAEEDVDLVSAMTFDEKEMLRVRIAEKEMLKERVDKLSEADDQNS